MPPKKAGAADEEPLLLGRFGTSLKMGLVGLPNVGKSTLFNVLTKSAVAAENYPFCTIDPTDARVAVPDERFDWLCEHWNPASKVPSFLHVVDIAGLVKGASEGQGLGNAFLSHIRGTDGIFQVVRAFEDPDVVHVENDVNPVRDMQIILEELRLKDLEYVKGNIQANEKVVSRSNDKEAKAELALMKRVGEVLDSGKAVRNAEWNREEVEFLNKHLFLTAKPTIFLVNLSESDFIRKKNKWLPKIKEYVDANENIPVIIPFSAAFELKLLEMEEEEREAYCKENKVSSMLPKIITTGFSTLRLEYFFTAGKDEVRAWTIQKHTKAPQAAGKIHTDFEKGFIMAEVMSFVDYKEAGSEAAAKAAGKYRQQGKQYVVQDGDIILFKFNAGAGLKGGKK
eukprot:m.320178 g.320178  ORF g.320178 m.320178 type:complete len:397 (+) comp23838_c0_seq1:108-1298(+)